MVYSCTYMATVSVKGLTVCNWSAAVWQASQNGGNLNSVNVLDVLVDMRRYRMGLIQTPDQLRFSYLALIEGAKRLFSNNANTVWMQSSYCLHMSIISWNHSDDLFCIWQSHVFLKFLANPPQKKNFAVKWPHPVFIWALDIRWQIAADWL